MSGEATDLVARLRERTAYDKKFYPPADPMWTEAAALIEAQAAEIEEARQIISDLRDDDNDWRVMTPDQRRRAEAFLASRPERADG